VERNKAEKVLCRQGTTQNPQSTKNVFLSFDAFFVVLEMFYPKRSGKRGFRLSAAALKAS